MYRCIPGPRQPQDCHARGASRPETPHREDKQRQQHEKRDPGLRFRAGGPPEQNCQSRVSEQRDRHRPAERGTEQPGFNQRPDKRPVESEGRDGSQNSPQGWPALPGFPDPPDRARRAQTPLRRTRHGATSWTRRPRRRRVPEDGFGRHSRSPERCGRAGRASPSDAHLLTRCSWPPAHPGPSRGHVRGSRCS